MIIKNEYREEKRKRFRLYASRATIWFLMGFCLELGTSIIADGIYHQLLGSDSILGLVAILVVAIIALIFNGIKAKRSRPIYSMDNDLTPGLFVLFAVTGSFTENFCAEYFIPILPDNNVKYIIACILLLIGIVLIGIDVIIVDRWYEKISGISHVDFQYKVDDNKSESYVKAVLRVNAAWIIAPVVAAIICGVWIALVIVI